MSNHHKEYLSDYQRAEALEPNVSGSSHINISLVERIASVAGGLALNFIGMRKLSLKNLGLSAAGGYLIYRGLSGHCLLNELMDFDTSDRDGAPVLIKKAVTINKPREEVYKRWRDLENLPGLLKHLKEIKAVDGGRKRYHWEMSLPKGFGAIHWDAEIVEEEENQLLTFRTYNGSDVSQSGRVEFKDAPPGRGTEMHATIKYYPPAGDIGGSIAKTLNAYISTLVLADMKRFKQYLETGEIPQIEGQPSGRNKNY